MDEKLETTNGPPVHPDYVSYPVPTVTREMLDAGMVLVNRYHVPDCDQDWRTLLEKIYCEMAIAGGWTTP